MKSISEFTADERAIEAASYRKSAASYRKMADFKGLTKKQARAYRDYADTLDKQAVEWSSR